MAVRKPSSKKPAAENVEAIKARLEEAEATLEAIRSGTVDALVGENNQIFTLKSADFSYRVLVESMNQGAVTLSSDGTILYCNSFFGRMLNMPLKHLIGSNIVKFIKPDQRKSFKDLSGKTASDQRHEFQFMAADKTPIPVYLTVKPLELGIPQTITGMIVTDLTETKRSEETAAAEKLAVQQLVFEHESAQKAKELEYVMKQRRDLQASNRAKDEFISIASHQLRTPATAVKQYLGMLMEGYGGEVPESFQFFLETAYSSNERQLSIIDELLKIAQIDSGNFKLKKEPANIRDLVKEVVADAQPMASMRKQKLSFAAKGDTSTMADAHEIALAVSNLIENASKYSPNGSVISAQVIRRGKYIEIRVQDAGVGIKTENLRKIFDKFTRVDNDMSDTVSGTGLGLYWVKRIVKLHKGSIKVQSELHKGSTFIMSIPA